MPPPRVAYFPDSFHEVNGVAHTSRNFAAYAQRHQLPFLCVRAGPTPSPPNQSGHSQTLELPRSFASVGLEKDLAFDPLFIRHITRVERELTRFQPDIIHITGPSELGLLGAWFAHDLGIPLAASWHTNVHEYAGRRLNWLTSHLPQQQASTSTEAGVEAFTLSAISWLYRKAQILFAPNRELCAQLEAATGTPCHLMQRGVDTNLFNPTRRTRPFENKLVLGYVGRLSIEKNVALLPLIEQQLTALGHDIHFIIIGHGSEESALRAAFPAATASFAGVLRGEALATAYANMDLLVFPSHTDTFGNVVLEALASAVPAIVTPDGGPKYIVQNSTTGFIVRDEDFANAIATLANNRPLLTCMRENARTHALTCNWDAVFHRVYTAYQTALPR